MNFTICENCEVWFVDDNGVYIKPTAELVIQHADIIKQFCGKLCFPEDVTWFLNEEQMAELQLKGYDLYIPNI